MTWRPDHLSSEAVLPDDLAAADFKVARLASTRRTGLAGPCVRDQDDLNTARTVLLVEDDCAVLPVENYGAARLLVRVEVLEDCCTHGLPGRGLLPWSSEPETGPESKGRHSPPRDVRIMYRACIGSLGAGSVRGSVAQHLCSSRAARARPERHRACTTAPIPPITAPISQRR